MFYQYLLVLTEPLGIIAREKFDLPFAIKLPMRPLVNAKMAHRSASVERVHEAGQGVCDFFSA